MVMTLCFAPLQHLIAKLTPKVVQFFWGLVLHRNIKHSASAAKAGGACLACLTPKTGTA
jgi:hypothetical protein